MLKTSMLVRTARIESSFPHSLYLLKTFMVIRTAFIIFTSIRLTALPAGAQNPVIDHLYTADPAALVVNETVYLFTGHDEATPTGNGYVMDDWHVFSSTDMVTWEDHGEVLTIGTFDWAASNAWASHVTERNGKYYWYVTVSPKASVGGAFAVGVAVADHPAGPYTDALGTALITDEMTSDVDFDIDPAVFIDDDGQAYLYWGNGRLKAVKLTEDMVRTEGAMVDITPRNFTEAAYLNKRNGIYYLTYAANWPETIEYATAASPMGPFTYGGLLNDRVSSTTNHQSLIEFRGQWYFIYHTADLPGGGDFRRSVAVEYLFWNDDNTIVEIVQTPYGVAHTDSTAECPPLKISPEFIVNDGQQLQSRRVTVTEGDDVILLPQLDAVGNWHWEKEGETVAAGNVLELFGISVQQSGRYLAVFEAECGTHSYASYDIHVNYPLPDAVISGNTYALVCVASGKAVTLEGGGTSNGTNVVQAPREGLQQQRFDLTLEEDVYWKITPEQVPGRALDVFNISQDNGANIVIWDYWGGHGQQWQLAEVGDGIYNIISRNSGKCLDVNLANNNVLQWECHGGDNQAFRLETPLSAAAEISETGVSVAPNPSEEGQFRIRSTGEPIRQVTVYNAGGAVVAEGDYHGTMEVEPGFRLSPGLYFATIRTDGAVYTEKLMVAGAGSRL
jgi:hypothetical protein